MLEMLKINILNNGVQYVSSPLVVLRILKVTSEEIKMKFRELERYLLKSINDARHRVFNETCLNNELLPARRMVEIPFLVK